MEKNKEEINKMFTDSSVDNEKGIKSAIAVFIHGVWYARLIRTGKKYDFRIQNWEIGEAKRIYSLPKNEVYPAWTRKEAIKTVNYIANTAWSKFKPKLAIKGYIIENNNFIVI
jgi:hypothetical protein